MQRGALAGRLAAVEQQADPLARRTVPQLVKDDPGARKAVRRPPALADGPGKAGFDRGRVGAEIVAVEAEPGFEPERIARPEPDRLDLGLGAEQVGEGDRVFGGDAQLEAVLAGVARTREKDRDAGDLGLGRGHEGQGVQPPVEPGQHPRRLRPLEGEQGELTAKLADPEFYKSDAAQVAAVKARLEAVEAEHAAAFARWEELEARQ